MLTRRRSALGATLFGIGSFSCGASSDVDAIVRLAVDHQAEPEPVEATETEADPLDAGVEAVDASLSDDEPEPPELVDVISPRDAAASALPDAGPCVVGNVVLLTRYRVFLRDAKRCLGIGAPVVANGFYTWYARASEYCEDHSTLWQLVQSGEFFELRNVPWNMNVQIQEQGGAPGDDALLFPPINDDHQRFSIRERAGGYFAFTPSYAPEMCLSAGLNGRLELAPCWPGTSSQEWSIQVQECEPPPPPPSSSTPSSSSTSTTPSSSSTSTTPSSSSTSTTPSSSSTSTTPSSSSTSTTPSSSSTSTTPSSSSTSTTL